MTENCLINLGFEIIYFDALEKINKKQMHQKNQKRNFPTIIQAQFVPKI